MSTSPASSGCTAVPSKRSPSSAVGHCDDENSPSYNDDACGSGSSFERPSASSRASQPSLRVNAPSSSSAVKSPSGLVAAMGSPPQEGPFTFSVKGTEPVAHDLSSPHELVPLSSSCSSTSSLAGLAAAFSNVDVEAPIARSVSPNVARGIFQPPPQPGVNAPPKKNAHSKPAPQGHVPRPRNPYILYRMDVVARGLIKDEKKHQNISKVVSEMWNNLSTEDKAPYVAAAHLEKMEHKRLYPNYIYQPGNDRPKPARAPRVHKGSKAAESKAAAAKKAAAMSTSKKGKGREVDQMRAAAEELERAAEEEDDSDYQPSKKRSSKTRNKISPPRPSTSSRQSSFSSHGAGDDSWDSSGEYEQFGRKRRSAREPFGSLDGTESPALSGRSVVSEASSDIRSSTGSSLDGDQVERMRMDHGFHPPTYAAANAPRTDFPPGQPPFMHPSPYFAAPPPSQAGMPPQPSQQHLRPNAFPPSGAQHQPPPPPPQQQFFYAPYPNYSVPPDLQYLHPQNQPGNMGPPSFPAHSQPPQSEQEQQPNGLPAFRSSDFQFLPTAEPSPLTPGFPHFNGHRRGSSFSALGPRPPRRESAGFGLGFQEEETPRTAAFREAFLPRSPAFPPSAPAQGETLSSTSSAGTYPASERPNSDPTRQAHRSGPVSDLYSREALRPQTFPRATIESSIRQSWHLGDQEIFVPPPPAHSPAPQAPYMDVGGLATSSTDASSSRRPQQQHQAPASHFSQPIQRNDDLSAEPSYLPPGGMANVGLDLSTRRKGRPEPLEFTAAPAAVRQPYFRTLANDGQAELESATYSRPVAQPQQGRGHTMDDITPTQANFLTEYYTIPFDEGPAWQPFDPSAAPSQNPSGSQPYP